MIRYYAYYNCGGYKDMWLGNSNSGKDTTYFLPLLPIWERKWKESQDKTAKEYLDKAKSLPLIQIISKDNSRDFPASCGILFSHGGYKAIYMDLSNGDSCLAIRGIASLMKDDDGRATPFSMMFIASGSDVTVLDNFAVDFIGNEQRIMNLLTTLFQYDPYVNGIKFEIGKLDGIVRQSPKLSKPLDHSPGSVNYLAVDSVGNISMAETELGLKDSFIKRIFVGGKILKGKLNTETKDSSLIVTGGNSPGHKDNGESSNSNKQSARDITTIQSSEETEKTYSHTLEISNNIKSYLSEGLSSRIEEILAKLNALTNMLGSQKNASMGKQDSDTMEKLGSAITHIGKLDDKLSSINQKLFSIETKVSSLESARSKLSTSSCSKPSIIVTGGVLLAGIIIGAILISLIR